MIQIQEKYQIVCSNKENTFFRAVSKKDKKQVAIKKINFANMTQKDKKTIIQQVNLLRSVKSNNIVRYCDYIIDKTQANLFVVMQYCSGQSLQDFLRLNRQQGKYVQQKAIWKIFSQIVSAINQIHSDQKGAIIHRDIKPKNILLDKDNNVKLGNFSLIRRLNPQEQFAMTYIPGTYYRSPEQVKEGIYSIQSDIWALGCLLYEMACLKPPFKKSTDFLTAQSINEDNVEDIPSFYSQQLKRVINWCLQKQRENRPTAGMLKCVPEINLRLKKIRLAEISKLIQQKKEKIKKRQNSIKNLSAQAQQLEMMQHLEQQKQNYQGGNC